MRCEQCGEREATIRLTAVDERAGTVRTAELCQPCAEAREFPAIPGGLRAVLTSGLQALEALAHERPLTEAEATTLEAVRNELRRLDGMEDEPST